MRSRFRPAWAQACLLKRRIGLACVVHGNVHFTWLNSAKTHANAHLLHGNDGHTLQAFPSADPECSLNDPWTSSDPDSYMRQLCAPGYYGPVCSLCVKAGNATYGRVGALECKPCRRTVTIIAAYVASALLVLAWLTITIHVTLVENEEAAAGHDNPQRTSQLIRVSFLVLVVPPGILTARLIVYQEVMHCTSIAFCKGHLLHCTNSCWVHTPQKCCCSVAAGHPA